MNTFSQEQDRNSPLIHFTFLDLWLMSGFLFSFLLVSAHIHLRPLSGFVVFLRLNSGRMNWNLLQRTTSSRRRRRATSICSRLVRPEMVNPQNNADKFRTYLTVIRLQLFRKNVRDSTLYNGWTSTKDRDKTRISFIYILYWNSLFLFTKNTLKLYYICANSISNSSKNRANTFWINFQIPC